MLLLCCVLALFFFNLQNKKNTKYYYTRDSVEGMAFSHVWSKVFRAKVISQDSTLIFVLKFCNSFFHSCQTFVVQVIPAFVLALLCSVCS